MNREWTIRTVTFINDIDLTGNWRFRCERIYTKKKSSTGFRKKGKFVDHLWMADKFLFPSHHCHIHFCATTARLWQERGTFAYFLLAWIEFPFATITASSIHLTAILILSHQLRQWPPLGHFVREKLMLHAVLRRRKRRTANKKVGRNKFKCQMKFVVLANRTKVSYFKFEVLPFYAYFLYSVG